MEKTYRLDLSRDQWEKLLASTYLAGWMTTAHLDEDSEGPFEELEQAVLKQSVDYGFDSQCQYSAAEGLYYYTEEAADQYDQVIEDYDDLTFWEELSTRMAERDVTFMKLRDHEKAEKVMQLAGKYDLEFEKNGLKNLVMNKGNK